ncbi:MAG TPA: nitroreductase/quinone reductase family protein [Candidatus Lumbricidophila sp.]|nr:nitroreductase/quinone reductase family protein [Candidatus Lumbricidophila sp.]
MNAHSDWNQQIIDEFRSNDGTVATNGFGRSLVLVHHLGAKSAKERVTPVMGIPTSDGWIIAASKAGAPDNPGWYYNLIAHPDTVVEAPGEGVVAVHAEVLAGHARDEAWSQFKARSSGFSTYEQRTSRVIPVIALHRRPNSRA